MVDLLSIPDQSYFDDGTNRINLIIAAINGYSGQGMKFNLIGYSDDNDFQTKIRNKGLDGLHWAVYNSGADPTTAAPIVEVEDIGLIVASVDFRVYDTTNVVMLVNSTGVSIGVGYPLVIGDDLTVGGDLTVNRDTTTGRDLHVGRNAFTTGGMSVGTNLIAGTSIHATTFLQADTSLSVGTSAGITGALTVGGTSTLSTSSAGNALDVINTNSAGNSLIVRKSTTAVALTVPASTGIVTAAFGLSTAADLTVVNVNASGTVAATIDVTAGGSISTTHAVTAGTNITATAGNITATAGTITAGSTVQGTRLISTVSTGTAPLTVSSTTLVSNLNANLLNGLTTGNASGNIAVNNNALNTNLIAQYVGTTGHDEAYLLDRSHHTSTQLSSTISDLAATVATLDAHSVQTLVPGHASGNIPISDTTLNTNLNANLLNSLNTGNSSGQIPVSNGTLNTNLTAQYVGASSQDAAYLLDRTHHTGTAPANSITQGSGSTLDADTVDGVHASGFGTTADIANLAAGIASLSATQALYLPLTGGTISSTLAVNGNLSVSTNGFKVLASANQTTINSGGSAHGTYDLTVGAGGVYMTGDLEVAGGADAIFSDNVTIGGTVSWADNSGSGLTFSSPSSGYLNVTIPGVGVRKVPYFV